MRARHVRKHLAAYLNGELKDRTRRRIARHLETCAECVRAYEALRTVHGEASRLPLPSPDERVWQQIEAGLARGPAKAVTKKRTKLRVQIAAIAVLLIAVSTVWYLLRPVPLRTLDLDPYLAALEANPEEAFPRAFALEPSEFSRVDQTEALRAAGLERASSPQPAQGFELVGSRAHARDASTVQLLYGSDNEVFAVFIVPREIELAFGTRDLQRADLEEISGGTVAAENLAVYWTVTPDRHVLLVCRIPEESRRAHVVRYFITALED